MTKEILATIWRTPDELWAQIEPVIQAKDPPKPKGRKRVNARLVLDTLLYRLRSGCQWNHLPGELADDSSAHRPLQRWRALGHEVGANPTDRGKAGVKRSLLVEADGGPLAVFVAPANRHDTKLLATTLEAISRTTSVHA